MTKLNQQNNPLFTSKINYPISFDGCVKSNLPYSTDPLLVMDIYYPGKRSTPAPVVILVIGYPDQGFEQMTGLKIKEVQQYISWAQLFAVSGTTAITYSNIEPEKDIFTLLQHLKGNAVDLGIDSENISLWSCSGNVPNALSVLASDSSIKCAALLYGFMIDLNCSQVVADASEVFKFVHPLKGVNSLPEFPPILVVRAGQDEMQGLNSSIDTFIDRGLKNNMPVTLINLPEAHHSFDLFDESKRIKTTIRNILEFINNHLTR
ncbi:hypothetical protein HQQ94_11770 [Shewanella sp. VB17]|uniref:alpha/beta hydrolase n=1 Tax=Shewanella sp. VB17 TaxID=2739432 RepID=UPI001566FE7B|nr:hypothetical protein [Shewanella sp. VB17]NRD73899.1 hypothetical protein [Shewanella sp. VB17]